MPYAVPNEFFSMETFPEIKRLFVKTPFKKTKLKKKEKVFVEISDSPAEFHLKKELKELEEYIKKNFPALKELGEKYE